MVTINVSPGGAAVLRRMHLAGPLAFRLCGQLPQVSVAEAPAYEGDIPRGRVRVLPARGVRRRRGQHSRPRTRDTSPAGRECPRHTQDVPPLQYGQDSTHILLTLMVVNCHQIDRGCQKWIMQPPLSHGRA